MVAFVASLMILFMNSGVIADPALMLVAAAALTVVIGAACGLLNGLITTVGKIEPFIATLGTMGIFRGLTTWLSQGGAITLRSPEQQELYRPVYFGSVARLPLPILIISRGHGHRRLHPLSYPLRPPCGGGRLEPRCRPLFRRRGGSRPHHRLRHPGLCVAIAVLLYVPRLGSTSATTGILWELQAITAVVVGGTALKGGAGRVWGTICGAFILELVGNIMLLSNFISEYLIGAIQGAIIIIAMLVQRSLARKG